MHLCSNKPNLYWFSQLEFKPHSIAQIPEFADNKQAMFTFDNGYGISVLLGSMFYSNGKNTYEIALFENGKMYCPSDGNIDSVAGHQTPEEIEAVMNVLSQLTPKLIED